MMFRPATPLIYQPSIGSCATVIRLCRADRRQDGDRATNPAVAHLYARHHRIILADARRTDVGRYWLLAASLQTGLARYADWQYPDEEFICNGPYRKRGRK